ncbi:ankyrin repeat domain-containing protein 26-like [Halyomorpha halys]|uniref:ankyrin repeat domain-containing protein 26-like n=1 Tax=Halyomorpha halys TaxID=286706 RepID=UPI0006D500BE
MYFQGQLLEAQQSAKQSRKEQAQMMDQIIALTAELESVNITDDNKIHEKLFESQQECNKLQNTISTLQSELMSLKEKCLMIDEENHLLQQKLDSYKKEKKFLNNKSEKQFEDILFKISRLEEELVIVGSKYMQCNEEKTKIARELANLKLDYQAISHQPYFNLIFALPCIMLVLAVTLAFYPTLSLIMGTAEHLDEGGSS